MAQGYPGPGRQDWATFLISVVFTAVGMLILPSDPSVGIVTLALFGSCAVVLGAIVARKLRPEMTSSRTSKSPVEYPSAKAG